MAGGITYWANLCTGLREGPRHYTGPQPRPRTIACFPRGPSLAACPRRAFLLRSFRPGYGVGGEGLRELEVLEGPAGGDRSRWEPSGNRSAFPTDYRPFVLRAKAC